MIDLSLNSDKYSTMRRAGLCIRITCPSRVNSALRLNSAPRVNSAHHIHSEHRVNSEHRLVPKRAIHQRSKAFSVKTLKPPAQQPAQQPSTPEPIEETKETSWGEVAVRGAGTVAGFLVCGPFGAMYGNIISDCIIADSKKKDKEKGKEKGFYQKYSNKEKLYVQAGMSKEMVIALAFCTLIMAFLFDEHITDMEKMQERRYGYEKDK